MGSMGGGGTSCSWVFGVHNQSASFDQAHTRNPLGTNTATSNGFGRICYSVTSSLAFTKATDLPSPWVVARLFFKKRNLWSGLVSFESLDCFYFSKQFSKFTAHVIHRF